MAEQKKKLAQILTRSGSKGVDIAELMGSPPVTTSTSSVATKLTTKNEPPGDLKQAPPENLPPIQPSICIPNYHNQNAPSVRGGQKPRVTLRKLPMWGQQVSASQIDFEWPSLDEIRNLPSYVSLKQMTLKKGNEHRGTGNYPLYYAKCTLSNNFESPVFKSRNNTYQSGRVVDFQEMGAQVRSVQAFSRMDDFQILSIAFKDEAGDIVGMLGEGSFMGGPEFELDEREELIGFYGVKGRDPTCFTSFGLIAMTREFS